MVHGLGRGACPGGDISGSGRACFLRSTSSMSSVLPALMTAVTVLGIWTAASIVATPVLVLCLRSTARVNARFDQRARREAWRAASNEL